MRNQPIALAMNAFDAAGIEETLLTHDHVIQVQSAASYSEIPIGSSVRKPVLKQGVAQPDERSRALSILYSFRTLENV